MKGKKITCHFLLSAWILFLLFPIFSAPASDKNIKTNDLTVKVTGLKSDKGSVIIKLFNSKESYSVKGVKEYLEISALIKRFQCRSTFPKSYARRVHD